MANTQETMLTTRDNPFNPHDNYEQWLYYDTQQGYNTQSYVARVYASKLAVPEDTEYIEETLNETYEEVIKMNPLGLDYVLI